MLQTPLANQENSLGDGESENNSNTLWWRKRQNKIKKKKEKKRKIGEKSGYHSPYHYYEREMITHVSASNTDLSGGFRDVWEALRGLLTWSGAAGPRTPEIYLPQISNSEFWSGRDLRRGPVQVPDRRFPSRPSRKSSNLIADRERGPFLNPGETLAKVSKKKGPCQV